MTPATVAAGDIAAIARETENLGYESLFIPEHPVIPVGFKTVPPGGGPCPEVSRPLDGSLHLIGGSRCRYATHQAGHRHLPPPRTRSPSDRQSVRDARYRFGWARHPRRRCRMAQGRDRSDGREFWHPRKRLRETVEALRLLWTQPEPSYQGEIVHLAPSVAIPSRCSPVARRFCSARMAPKVSNASFAAMTAGVPSRASLQISSARSVNSDPSPRSAGAIPTRSKSWPCGPREDGLSLDNLKDYQDAGVSGLVLFSQRDAIKMADGQALDVIRRVAPTIERAAHL